MRGGGPAPVAMTISIADRAARASTVIRSSASRSAKHSETKTPPGDAALYPPTHGEVFGKSDRLHFDHEVRRAPREKREGRARPFGCGALRACARAHAPLPRRFGQAHPPRSPMLQKHRRKTLHRETVGRPSRRQIGRVGRQIAPRGRHRDHQRARQGGTESAAPPEHGHPPFIDPRRISATSGRTNSGGGDCPARKSARSLLPESEAREASSPGAVLIVAMPETARE